MPTNVIQDTLTAPLKSLEAPRVWSMLVTIFGDLAQSVGDHIDGPLLTRMTQGLDIKPEAVRVALHRLRQDNWITSEKHGRTASHRLTSFGLAQSLAASHLIYATRSELEQSWQVLLIEKTDPAQKQSLEDIGFSQIAPRLFIGARNLTPPKQTLVLTGAHVPDWVGAQICEDDITNDYKILLARLSETSDRAARTPPRDALDIAILRALIVHHWRRLVLRHPYLPPAITGPDWPGHVCRDQVAVLLRALPRPTLSKLHEQ